MLGSLETIQVGILHLGGRKDKPDDSEEFRLMTFALPF